MLKEESRGSSRERGWGEQGNGEVNLRGAANAAIFLALLISQSWEGITPRF